MFGTRLASSRKVKFAIRTLADPYRVIIDLSDVKLNLPSGRGKESKGLVKGYRYGRVEPYGVRIILDVGHADCSDGVRPAFEAFAPYLRHIHVHDSDGQRDHHEIGKAGLDFNAYLDVLKPFPFTLAIESRDEMDPAGCVLRSRDALKAVLKEAAR